MVIGNFITNFAEYSSQTQAVFAVVWKYENINMFLSIFN
jgi:hypothetical protein